MKTMVGYIILMGIFIVRSQILTATTIALAPKRWATTKMVEFWRRKNGRKPVETEATYYLGAPPCTEIYIYTYKYVCMYIYMGICTNQDWQCLTGSFRTDDRD